MALKEPAKTIVAGGQSQSSTTSNLSLPAPQTFDILPPLHELLARVEAYENQNRAPTDPTAHVNNEYGGDVQPLDPKDFPTAALEIKSRIGRALKELEKLPDMDRSTPELDEEILELETRIAKQKEMLRRLKIVSGEAANRKLG